METEPELTIEERTEAMLSTAEERSRRHGRKRPPPRHAVRIWERQQKGESVEAIAKDVNLDVSTCYKHIRRVEHWRTIAPLRGADDARRQHINTCVKLTDIVIRDYYQSREPHRTIKTTYDENGQKTGSVITEEPAQPSAPLAMAACKLLAEQRAILGLDVKTTRIQNSVNVLHHVDMTGIPAETVAELRRVSRRMRRHAVDVQPDDASSLPDAPGEPQTHASDESDASGAGQ